VARQQSSAPTQSTRRKHSGPTRRPDASAVAAQIRSTVVSDEDVLRFVERTTAASNVPVLVEDVAAIEQVARVLL
jgi:hypothetical protein